MNLSNMDPAQAQALLAILLTALTATQPAPPTASGPLVRHHIDLTTPPATPEDASSDPFSRRG